jgi:hypothetical protein
MCQKKNEPSTLRVFFCIMQESAHFFVFFLDSDLLVLSGVEEGRQLLMIGERQLFNDSRGRKSKVVFSAKF